MENKKDFLDKTTPNTNLILELSNFLQIKLHNAFCGKGKAPKINFNNEVLHLRPKVMILSDLDFNVPEVVTNLLEEHYSRISGILGFDKLSDNYNFIIEEIEGKGGYHESTGTLTTRGVIALSLESFKEACRPFLDNYRSSYPAELAFIPLIECIESTAHELYHKRQAIFFKRFYESRNNKYIDKIEYFKYRKQLIEIGARAFAKKYIDFLKSQINENDSSAWATSLKTYVSLEEFTGDDFELVEIINNQINIYNAQNSI